MNDPLKSLLLWLIGLLSRVETPGRLTPKLLESSPMIKLELDGVPPANSATKAEVRYKAEGATEETAIPLVDGKVEVDGGEAEAGSAYLRFSRYGRVKNGPILPLKFSDFVPDVEEPGALTAKFIDDTPDTPPAEAGGATATT